MKGMQAWEILSYCTVWVVHISRWVKVGLCPCYRWKVKGHDNDQGIGADIESQTLFPTGKGGTEAACPKLPQPDSAGSSTSTPRSAIDEEQQSQEGLVVSHPFMNHGSSKDRESDRRLDQRVVQVLPAGVLEEAGNLDPVPEITISPALPRLPEPEDEDDPRGPGHIEDSCAEKQEVDIFGSEVAKRTFLEKDEEYSEIELIELLKAVNGRITHLSGHLIKMRNSMRGNNMTNDRSESEASNPGPRRLDVGAELVRASLGERLYQELASVTGKTVGSKAVDHALRDGLDAWSISCVYQAMNPILFGLRVRTNEEVNQILGHMMVHEPEMAECWNRIRAQNSSIETEAAKSIREFVSNAWPLHQLPDKDHQEYSKSVLLEELYRLASESDGGYELQILLHWRALLHKHELELESYKAATRQTKETLQQGLLRVFELVGEEPPLLSDNPNLLEMFNKIVEEAGTLAKWTKTTVFSENAEVFMVKPGTKFDNDSMISADKVNEGLVKCTTKLGLRVTDATTRNRKILMKAEVLLI